MIVHKVQQGTAEWHDLRCGVITASRFAEIVTPSTLKLSKQSRGYMLEKLAEWALGEPADMQKSGFMERGSDLEAEAIAAYEWEYDVTVDRVGFVTDDRGLVGCSPDGLIGNDSGIEVKILGAVNHLDAILSPPNMNDHKAQINGNMMICERSKWIRWYWHPKLPGLRIEFERDAEYVAALTDALYSVNGFIDQLDAMKQQLLDLGFNPGEPVNPLDPDPANTDILEVIGVLR